LAAPTLQTPTARPREPHASIPSPRPSLPRSLAPPLTLPLSLSPALPLFHTHTHSLSLSPALPLFHTHTHSLSPPLSLPPPLPLPLPLRSSSTMHGTRHPSASALAALALAAPRPLTMYPHTKGILAIAEEKTSSCGPARSCALTRVHGDFSSCASVPGDHGHERARTKAVRQVGTFIGACIVCTSMRTDQYRSSKESKTRVRLQQ
jgi:hypothetical protein